MAVIVKTYTFSPGAVILAAEHNTNFDTIYSEFNGSIDNNNIKALAGIVDTKLAQIVTPSKVSGLALTGLASISTTAGAIPAMNVSIQTSYPASTGTGIICSATATSANSTGWALLYFVGGGTGFVPYWTGIET
jgi:hypothetical protein